MTEIRNIMLIGRTGNGKSTLANVLSGTDKFRESEGSVSETKDVQVEEVEVTGIKYKIIDTIGIGDTVLDKREVLRRIAVGARMVKDGLHQMIFVAGGRFTKEEADAYRLLRTVIFDKDIVNYTTIVRTRFPSFFDADKVEEDKEKLIKEGKGENATNESKETANIFKSCNKVLYVDNPPVNTGRERTDKNNRETREEAREILVLHLVSCDTAYKPSNLNELNERIDNVMTEREMLEKEMDEYRKQIAKKEELAEQEREKLMRKFEEGQEKYKELTQKIAEQTEQVVEERNPGFCERMGRSVDDNCTIS